MKTLVTHDADGRILGLAVGPSLAGGPPVAAAAEAGQYVSEVEVPSALARVLQAKDPDEKRIVKALEAYRVSIKEAKLVK
jgi:hypothetical protein